MDIVKHFAQLLKFRLSATVVFSAIMGYLLGTETVEFSEIIKLIFGGFLVTGCANAFNQIWERNHDALMQRTLDRPLPKGNLSVIQSLVFATFIGIWGLFMLYQINNYCAYYGLLSILLYVLCYTPLKRVSPISIFVGAIPGSIPFLLGWVAAYDFELLSSDFESGFGMAAGVLFAIQFFWQFPHFISISWVLDDEYKKAGFKMMIGGEKGKTAAIVSIICSLFLLFTSVFPYLFAELVPELGMSDFGFIIILILGILFTSKSFKLHKNLDNNSAKKLMFSSFIYLPLIQIVLVLDKYFVL